ncbi:DUF937 domain-containing protein [Kangiella sediminilitoris]|uniref:Uncharacterized protein n=1 Tax=Kangiella sediminilitoris TaxID=1144748 RepID=A0A1B3BCV5_9GAMM|nr:DUF937 domain-containing protein [Kangiella sediminilitoris]AOE50632.1 hypothetical protein KS2013_1923 [Kangiella sediminilitoris]
MQDLLERVLGEQNKDVIKHIGAEYNLEQDESDKVFRYFLPLLIHGLRHNCQLQDEFEAVMRALLDDGNEQYIERPAEITEEKAIDNGNSILGHIIKTKDKSREVARYVTNKTGFDLGVMKQMLPVTANLLMGTLSKDIQEHDDKRRFLRNVLDLDNDNVALDDASGMIVKIF